MNGSTLALAYGVGAKPRDRRDLYVEPPEAVDALCSVERLDGPIWDPAAGTRSLARVLTRHGYEVHATDGNDPGDARLDFLSVAAREHAGRFGSIVSNPPYRLAGRFALRAMALARSKVALFVRLQWLEGIERHRVIFKPHPPSRIWVFSGRLGMDKGATGERYASGMLAHAWVVWDLPTDPARRTVLNWISHRDEIAIPRSPGARP